MTEPNLPARPDPPSRETAPDVNSTSASPAPSTTGGARRADTPALEEPTTRGIDSLELPPLPPVTTSDSAPVGHSLKTPGAASPAATPTADEPMKPAVPRPVTAESEFRGAAAAATGGALSTGYRGYSTGYSGYTSRATGSGHVAPATGSPIAASQVPPALRGPEQPEEERKDEKKGFLGISGGQVLAGAMAASTSAVAASYLGVAGTVLGAGLGSVIATVSTAVYQKSIQRSGKVLQTVVTTTVGGAQVPVDDVLHEGRDSSTVAPDPSLPGVTQVGRGLPDPHMAETHVMDAVPEDATRPFGTPVVSGSGVFTTNGTVGGAAGGTAYGAASVPPPGRPNGDGTVYGGRPAWYDGLPWKRMALTSAALFLLVMGIITTIELFEGRTVADAVNGRQGSGTTFNHVVTGGNNSDTSPTPTPSDSESSSEDATPSESPSEDVSPSDEGSESPSGEPTESPDPTEGDVPADGTSEQPAPDETPQRGEASASAPIAPMTDSVSTLPSASPLD
ncbi:hypothetical protein [Cryptosporangium sp. NPDC048952]|uniref:hypothetical protein n=1 Tax=Cryptosporangium sp. NPDC048952 TaxID=3363961 RepID=UPI00371F3E37